MGKSILLTYADHKYNRQIASYLLSAGHRLMLFFDRQHEAEAWRQQLPAEQKRRCFFLVREGFPEQNVVEIFEQAIQKMNGLDVLMHGYEDLNEASLLKQEPAIFASKTVQQFQQLFLLNREAVRFMIRQKAGDIIFILVNDALFYAGYSSSPVLNHGKVALMKSMAKELTPFRVNVNAITFGYYDPGFERAEKKEKRKKLEMFALKPPLLTWKEMIPALDMLLEPAVKHWTGQNLHIAACTDTQI